MNLIIFDNKAFSEERTYYYCGGENYSYIKKIFPNIIELNKENTDEIIIYSGSNDNVSKKAKSVKVKEINIKNDSIRIDYEDGFTLIRQSNTGPVLTVRFERKNISDLEKEKEKYLELIKKISLEL